jgi:hypothetical protein
VQDLPRLEEFSAASLVKVDVLILAQGFEERTEYVPLLLRNAGKLTANTQVWVATYRTNGEDNIARFERVSPIIADTAAVEFFDADSPETSIARLRQLIHGLNPGSNIVFDVSGASATLIFSVIGVFARSSAKFDFVLTYTTARAYYPDEGFEEHDADKRHSADFLENVPRDSGAEEPFPHPLFRGIYQDSKPSHIVAVPGLGSYERFARCVAYVSEDEATDAGHSMTLILPHSEDESHEFREKVLLKRVEERFAGLADDPPNVAVKRCDYGQYTHIIEAIVECSDRHLGANVALVHLGPKMQSVGAALALVARDEVALVFARPTHFDAAHYSSGVGVAKALHLGSLQVTIDAIRSIGTIRVSRDEAMPDARFKAAS